MENEINFEDRIKKAKEILEKLQSPDITLAESIKAYEEGIKELNEATKLLETAKQKVQVIKES